MDVVRKAGRLLLILPAALMRALGCYLMMKLLIQIACLLAVMMMVSGQQPYRHTDSYPKLHITSVSIPTNKTEPLKIAVTISCVGPTPIALSRDQFSVSISTERNPYLYEGDAIFLSDFPEIFRLNSNENIALVLFTFRDRTSARKSWRTLPAGKYRLRIYVNSDKTFRFDYQWLGQTYSNDYMLQIKRRGATQQVIRPERR